MVRWRYVMHKCLFNKWCWFKMILKLGWSGSNERSCDEMNGSIPFHKPSSQLRIWHILLWTPRISCWSQEENEELIAESRSNSLYRFWGLARKLNSGFRSKIDGGADFDLILVGDWEAYASEQSPIFQSSFCRRSQDAFPKDQMISFEDAPDDQWVRENLLMDTAEFKWDQPNYGPFPHLLRTKQASSTSGSLQSVTLLLERAADAKQRSNCQRINPLADGNRSWKKNSVHQKLGY